MPPGLEINLVVPDLWQQEAVRALRDGKDVVVQAPTGSGKTFIFELLYPLLKGQAIFTVPTRALANDKLAEWRARGWDVGIATGDLALNLGAKVLVATLETQRARFLRRDGPRLLVVDEYQMIADPVRGVHYELALALAPPKTQLLLLSGSVKNPQDVVSWFQRIGRDALLVAHNERPVPLEEIDLRTLPESHFVQTKNLWPRLIGKTLRADLAPVLVFAPRRNASEEMAQAIASAIPVRDPLSLSAAQEGLAGKRLSKLLRSRVAYHHSGLSYAVRAGLIEPLAKAGQLNVVVATMGLAAGINFSMRSVLITDTRYLAGNFERHVQPDELLQMFGRAGRRGLDETGYILTLPDIPRLGDARARQLKFGSTAYYIVSGTVDISINNPLAHLRTRPAFGFFGRSVARMKSFLLDDGEDKRAEAHQRKFIGIDANIDLPINKPIAQLGPGELFGEMTCRTFQPRSATVVTREPCVMVEMLRVILDMLVGSRQVSDASKATSKVKAPTFKGTSFKTELEKKYRERSLETHLRSVPLFASVEDDFIAYLREKVELVSYNQNQIICKEGEEADAFYLIRSGMVRVSQTMPGGEMVRTYLSRGDYFGEIGLLRSIKRIATCAALDAVDVVKIPANEFNLMLEKFPRMRAQLEPVAEARMIATKSQTAPPGLGLDDFLNQGLFEAQNLLLIDLDNCTRCDACVQACAKAHDGVSRLLRDGLRYDHFLVATACRSCRDPLCMTQCPVGSIRRKENLEIIIEDWCIGCGKCAELCPYGNINMHPLEVIKEVKTEIKSPTPGEPPKVKIEKKKSTAYKANTCDLCTQLSVPSCVYACPHDAAKRVDPQRFFGDALEAQAEILKKSWKPEQLYETHTTH